MKKVFTTTVSANPFIENCCRKAVENACNRLLGTLQEYIDSEYYDMFDPDFYDRTYQFWHSATMRMLNVNCGEVFMNEKAMNYGEYWNGKMQLFMADAGYHGSSNIYTDGHFWSEFVKYCEENAVNILVEELIKQGLNIVKIK